jgi:hypothetical protein
MFHYHLVVDNSDEGAEEMKVEQKVPLKQIAPFLLNDRHHNVGHLDRRHDKQVERLDQRHDKQVERLDQRHDKEAHEMSEHGENSSGKGALIDATPKLPADSERTRGPLILGGTVRLALPKNV